MDQCIQKYIEICKESFGKEAIVPSTHGGLSKFDSKKVEVTIERMLEEANEHLNTSFSFLSSISGCHTFVVSTQSHEQGMKTGRVYKSYDTHDSTSISKALLTTIAHPLLFTPLLSELKPLDMAIEAESQDISPDSPLWEEDE